jgi:hypothetical protein
VRDAHYIVTGRQLRIQLPPKAIQDPNCTKTMLTAAAAAAVEDWHFRGRWTFIGPWKYNSKMHRLAPRS